jgi:hypothetical protein
MDAALRKDTLGARVSFACPSGTFNEGELVCLPSELIAHIAGYVWIVGVGYIGCPEPTGNSEGGFQEFQMPVSFLETCYAEALKPGAVPKFSISEMVDHLVAAHPTATILQWGDWADRLPPGSDQDAE